MKIEFHVIQNHAPANLNRDDLGAPKTAYFGGVLRTRISSQCLKRSIRLSPEFEKLMGGYRTRQFVKLLIGEVKDDAPLRKRVETIFGLLGYKNKPTKKAKAGESEAESQEKAKSLIYLSNDAVAKMKALLRDSSSDADTDLARKFAELICSEIYVPDMALSGRMIEPDKEGREMWKGLEKNIEASLQVAHAISTHTAHPEVDYYVAADDVPGDDAGAGFLDEAMFTSACFYKYFSIDWEQLVKNLKGNKPLAAHTVGAFLRAMALTNPTGKQNSYAAHNPPDGILVEIKGTPVSYANAFAIPAKPVGERDLISQSIAQLAQYAYDLDAGYGKPANRWWFSPNQRQPLTVVVTDKENGKKLECPVSEQNIPSLDLLVEDLVSALGFDWEEVKKVHINPDGEL